jgi:hypothetical protein
VVVVEQARVVVGDEIGAAAGLLLMMMNQAITRQISGLSLVGGGSVEAGVGRFGQARIDG